MKISKFLNHKPSVEEWLNKERELLDPELDYLSHWFTGEGVGIVLTRFNSGEFHVSKNGHVSMTVEESMGDVIFSSESTATDEKTLAALFDNFKKKIYEEST